MPNSRSNSSPDLPRREVRDREDPRGREGRSPPVPPRDLSRLIRACFQGEAWSLLEQALRGRQDHLLKALIQVNSHSDPIALGRLQGAIQFTNYLLDGTLKADMVILTGDSGDGQATQPYQPREITQETLNGSR